MVQPATYWGGGNVITDPDAPEHGTIGTLRLIR
jgi:hypothetical protein